jgi:hypothetical protein
MTAANGRQVARGFTVSRTRHGTIADHSNCVLTGLNSMWRIQPDRADHYNSGEAGKVDSWMNRYMRALERIASSRRP